MQKRKTSEANLESKRFIWFTVGLIAVLGLMVAAFAWTSYDIKERVLASLDLKLLDDEVIPQNLVQPPPPPPPPSPTTAIEIVDDEEDIEEEDIVIEEVTEDTQIEVMEVFDVEEEEEEVFMVVEKMPALPGCEHLRGEELNSCTQMEIIKYITSNTKYPPIAKDAGIQGTVFVYFEVGKTGAVQNVRVLRQVDSRLDKEAMRVVSSLPKFQPGEQRGKKVTIQYTIPVKFIIR